MSWASNFSSQLCSPASWLSSCFDSFFAWELTAMLSSFIRCLEERVKVANLGSAVWHPKPSHFCCWCKRYEVMSGCGLERYRFVCWCNGAVSPVRFGVLLAQRVPPSQPLIPVPVDEAPSCCLTPDPPQKVQPWLAQAVSVNDSFSGLRWCSFILD